MVVNLGFIKKKLFKFARTCFLSIVGDKMLRYLVNASSDKLKPLSDVTKQLSLLTKLAENLRDILDTVYRCFRIFLNGFCW